MTGFDIWLDRFAKMSCIGSLISQIVFGILGLHAVSQTPPPAPSAPIDHRLVVYFSGWLISIVYSITIAYFIFRRKGDDKAIEADNGTETETTDFRQLFLDEQLSREKYQDQFVQVRDERDQLRSELEHLKAQKPDTTVKDSDPQIEIKIADLRGQTMSSEAIKQACFDLINHGKQSSALFACIEDFKIGSYQVAFREFPAPIRPFENHDSIFPLSLKNPDGTPSKLHIFTLFYAAWQEQNNPKLYAYKVPIRVTYQDEARNLFEVRCDLVFYPQEFLSHMQARITAIGPIASGTTGAIIETKNQRLRKVAPAYHLVDWNG